MNRRSFLSQILKAGASAMILPPALTYARKWVATGPLIVPDASAAEIAFFNTIFYGKPIVGIVGERQGHCVVHYVRPEPRRIIWPLLYGSP